MKQIKHSTLVVNEGDVNCSHAFLASPFYRGLSFFPFKHEQEKVCFKCLRLEILTTSIVFDNPFTFKSVMKRLEEDAKKVVDNVKEKV